jgi:hypothetical protein
MLTAVEKRAARRASYFGYEWGVKRGRQVRL